MSNWKKLVVVLCVVAILAVIAAPALAAESKAKRIRQYTAAKYGIAKQYKLNGTKVTKAGVAFGGGFFDLNQCKTVGGRKYCLRTNVAGTSKGKYVRLGSAYGDVKEVK